MRAHLPKRRLHQISRVRAIRPIVYRLERSLFFGDVPAARPAPVGRVIGAHHEVTVPLPTGRAAIYDGQHRFLGIVTPDAPLDLRGARS